ncbi:MAG: hypothetical protein WA208_06685 [Thermoanaerobaculia bacterium]
MTLTPVETRDRKIIRRWSLAGDPHGVAIGHDGTIYVGLAKPQAVAAIDPKSGSVTKQVVLDSPEIASTKELVSMRTNADRTRLFIANGSDESVTILSLPDLAVLREITLEGEAIRDVIPDPGRKHLYILARRVHVYDYEGSTEIRTLDLESPMAIAVSSGGTRLAVIAEVDFGSAKATGVAMFDTTSLKELSRDPLQTDNAIEAALFAAGDQALVAVARQRIYEKPAASPPPANPAKYGADKDGRMRMQLDFGDIVNSDTICLPEGSGPQIAALVGPGSVVYAERRCSASGTFSGSERRVARASLYGVSAYAIAYDPKTNTIVATDRAGFLTIYRMPTAPNVK